MRTPTRPTVFVSYSHQDEVWENRLRPCPWKVCHWLTPIQMIPRDGQSVARDFKDNWDEPFAQVAGRIHEIVTDPTYRPPAPPPPRWAPPERIDIHRMPATGAELFGRRDEMAMLDEAWDSGRTHVVSLVAWGSVGKSTLVNEWLERMSADNYRGARRVFAWSFYSQGTGERVTSADQFVAQALDWFGDPDPTAGSSSPWAKGKRLADLVRRERTLPVLDGLEPLQSGSDYERGKVKDPGLAVLISELARRNPGLCVITTRGAVADLNPFPDTTRQEDLEQISAEVGRALLRVGGVRGTDAELEGAARDFGNHALALNLLAAYLHGIPGHHVSHADEIPDLPDVPVEAGRHPRRVMAAFAVRFGDGPELNVLCMLGLFDWPAGAEEIAALDDDQVGVGTEVVSAPSGGQGHIARDRCRARNAFNAFTWSTAVLLSVLLPGHSQYRLAHRLTQHSGCGANSRFSVNSSAMCPRSMSARV